MFSQASTVLGFVLSNTRTPGTIYPVFPDMLKILYVDRILLEEGAY